MLLHAHKHFRSSMSLLYVMISSLSRALHKEQETVTSLEKQLQRYMCVHVMYNAVVRKQ